MPSLCQATRKSHANRANAQLSTGPTSSDGKAKSSLNAVKTGLTGRTVLLPGDDAAKYEQHVQRFFKKYNPVEDENALVQAIADTEWRLLRIPSLESGIYAIGRRDLAAKFADEEDAAVRNTLIEAQVFITYKKELNNLGVQEGRLRKQREKDLIELQQMQAKRRRDRELDMKDALEIQRQEKQAGREFNPAQFGFEFSIQEMDVQIAFYEHYKAGNRPGVADRLARKIA